MENFESCIQLRILLSINSKYILIVMHAVCKTNA